MLTRKRRLLCFDGGGVRGLSSLYLLKQLMESINYDSPPKPCEWFDMIGGTSTGGLIAIMLGRLEMTVDECIEQYIALSNKVFRRQHMFPVNLRGRVQPRFSTAKLDDAIQKIIASSAIVQSEGTGADAVMRKETPSGCKTFVVALSGEFGDYHVVFSSYGRRGEANRGLYDSAKIREAARATSAASSFFEPIRIGNPPQTFLDGAIGRNNPITVLWDEARRLWPPQPNETMDGAVEYIVSIGTGKPSAEPFGETLMQVFNTIKAAATETENTANQFVRDHGDLVRRNGYYRFNVNQGLERVGLEEAEKAGVIAAATAKYGDDPDVQLMFQKLVEISQTSTAPHTNNGLAGEPNPNQKYRNVGPQRAHHDVSAYGTLDSTTKYIANRDKHQVPDCYWTHLTPDGMRVYETMYDACKDADGLVDFKTFTSQFNNRNPRPDLVVDCWTRLGPKSASFDKHHTLAVTYMIHLESMMHKEHLPQENGRPYLSDRRRKIISHFGKWVDCHCRCGRKWSYASSENGMQRDINTSRKCTVDRWMRSSPMTRWRFSQGKELEKDNRNLWFGRSSR